MIVYYNEEQYRVEEMYVMASVYNPNGDFDVTFTLPPSSSLLEIYFTLYMYDGYPFDGVRYEGYYGFYDGYEGKDINIGSIALYEY